jgi:hypothetical protein
MRSRGSIGAATGTAPVVGTVLADGCAFLIAGAAGGAGAGGGAGAAATNAIIVGISGNESVTQSAEIAIAVPTITTCPDRASSTGTVGRLGMCAAFPAIRSNMASFASDEGQMRATTARRECPEIGVPAAAA